MTFSNATVQRTNNEIFQNALTLLPFKEFDTETWSNGTGYMDNAGDDCKSLTKSHRFVDHFGRMGIITPNSIIMQRYSKEENSILFAHLFDMRGRAGDVYYVEEALKQLEKELTDLTEKSGL